MIIKNNLGIERNVEILFKLIKNNKEYIVYKDYNTGNVYGGILKDNHLNKLNDKEYSFLNNIYEKMV